MRFEWRYKSDDTDALIAVDDNETVQQAWEATAPLLEDFLNDMTEVGSQDGARQVDDDERDPAGWGELIIARTDTGKITIVDPGRYWHRIAYWFRSRGHDPHHWRGRQ